MLKRFYPTEYCLSIQDIDYDKLKEENIKGLLFDLDNTVAPFDVAEPTEDIIDFFKALAEKGFKICLLSNNGAERVEVFNRKLKLNIMPKAGKPKKKGIQSALKMIGCDTSNSVMIGDQMFTDVWVANRMGMRSILVKPIANRDEFTVRMKRGLEGKVFERYMKGVDNEKNINQ